MNVLICDDSGFARKQLARALPADWDVTLHYAANGLEGVEQVLMGHGDLIFLDLTMPEMDGVACIQQIIALDPGVRILAISAVTDKAIGIDALKKGARGFLPKPFSDEQLLAALHELVRDS